MKNFFTTILFAVKETFKNKKYIILFFFVFIVMTGLFTLIPVISVTGNTLEAQLDIFTAKDGVIIGLLSAMYALFVTMQVFLMKNRKRVRDIGTAIGGGIGALFAGIAGTAFCASCLIPLFALFGIGFGGVLVILQFRMYIIAVIIIPMALAIYFNAKRIQEMSV